MTPLGYLQKLGKALMLPIAVLPVAALLLRLGQQDLLDIPFITSAGGALFSNLPLLFAMGIALGLSEDNDGASVIAGTVGFFVLTTAAKSINSDVDLSFFGGVIAGIIAGHTYNRFHKVALPAWLSFFAGKRLTPIMTGLFCLAMAFVLGHVWPVVQNGINSFANSVSDAGAWGQFVYGFLNRALIPLGLHHLIHSIFWFSLGEFITPAGEVFIGDLPRFFAGDPTAGVFMAGFYPIMMFGLPAAALAMYLATPKERRTQVGGMLFSVAFTSFLTGVTEPIEFLFVFLAPVLYFIHAVLTGFSIMLANQLGTLHGFGFSAGAIDFILNWGLATQPSTLILIGVMFFVIYFSVFYGAIRVFNLNTPGRNQELVEGNCETLVSGCERGEHYIELLGGAGNLQSVDACITRLRLVVQNTHKINENGLKQLGVKGVMKLDEKNIQVIIGPEAEAIAGEIRAVLQIN